MMKLPRVQSVIIVALCILPKPIAAEAVRTCYLPQEPPYLEFEAAKEFRDMFTQDFEKYFVELRRYFQCLEEQRTELLVQGQEITKRYNRVLNDQKLWE